MYANPAGPSWPTQPSSPPPEPGTDWNERIAAHVNAMHLSGGLFLLTFLIPPMWLLDAVRALSPDDPSADWPSFLWPVLLLVSIAVFHACVQIPAGVVGSWLMAGRSALTGYLGALLLAGVLAVPTLVWVMGVRSGTETLVMWADYTGRCAPSLGVYLWFVRRCERRQARLTAMRSGSSYGPSAPRQHGDPLFPEEPRWWR
ncbi:hypothetical protein GL263_24950 [Streptomyces durbertensis]|uniref:Uncharacterized protein n=1 Tax=Streptomyces durbertensis TaxID=2448886 RepID=A0ABR6EN42_9ACTN|nr:hypothetical protein [Streptomyces durbertensis]MBB1246774.1 hypothetical protein [Streptomyces durbertensis]